MLRKARKRGGVVEGAGVRTRLDRPKRARGGSIKEQFNAAVNDQPARPTIREPGPLPAVHNREVGADEPHKMDEPRKGWVDGQPRKRGGRLTAGERQKMPKSDFALPGRGEGPKGAGAGSYPINDPSHARNALARVSQHGSAAEKAEVRRKVHAKYPDID